MKRRQVRQDGKTVSEVGLGCWSFGGAYGPTTQAESHNTLSAARDLGVDFLDTANIYGMGVSESAIGSYLKGNPDGFTIATKAGIQPGSATRPRASNSDERSPWFHQGLKSGPDLGLWPPVQCARHRATGQAKELGSLLSAHQHQRPCPVFRTSLATHPPPGARWTSSGSPASNSRTTLR